MVTRYILFIYSVLAIIQFHDPRDVKAQLEHMGDGKVQLLVQL